MTNSPPAPVFLDLEQASPSPRFSWGGFDDSWTRAPSDLLHNSGPIHRSQVIHREQRGRCGGPGLIVRGALLPEPATLRSVLALFTSDWVQETDVERRLRQEILAYGAKWLPMVALVTRQASQSDTVCADPRKVACLLTQASARVYLRDKEPNLSYLRRDREHILVFTL